jgi:hypothetical protein
MCKPVAKILGRLDGLLGQYREATLIGRTAERSKHLDPNRGLFPGAEVLMIQF